MARCCVGIFAIRLSSGKRLRYDLVDWFCVEKELPAGMLIHINYHPDTGVLEPMTTRQFRRFTIFCNA